MRLLALISALVTVVLALGLFMLARTGADGTDPALSTASPPRAEGGPAAAPRRADASKAHAPARARAAAHPGTTAAKDARPAVVRALAANRVVVVSLWAPGSSTDELADREARAGAQLAGATFVRIDVTRQREVAPLTAKLGLLADPAVLVYGPRSVTPDVRLDGFADREAVAQAAENVRQRRIRRGP